MIPTGVEALTRSGLGTGTAAACLLSLLLSSSAQAEPAPLGEVGQKVLFGNVGVELELGEREQDGLATDFAVSATPGALWFLWRNLAPGIALDAGYWDVQLPAYPYRELELGLQIGIGLNVPLSKTISFFPQLWAGGGYASLHYHDMPDTLQSGFNDPSLQAQSSSAGMDGPFVSAQWILPLQFQLSSTSYLTVGPRARLRMAIEHGRSFLRYGLHAGFGRYF